MRIVLDSDRTWYAALAALCAILVAPLLLTDVPPLLDYPNHLARMVLLAFGGQDPVLRRFAVAHWAIIPDLGMDLVLPPLLWVLPVHVAGRAVVGLFLLLPVLGGVAYSRALFGTRPWWALGAGLIAYNETVLLGFLNFTASIGVALLLAAAWLRCRCSKPLRTVPCFAVGAVGLFFCHLMGLAFFGLLVFVSEVAALRRETGRALRLAVLAAMFAPVALLYAISPLRHTEGPIEFYTPAMKLAQLLIPFINYNLPLDIATESTVAVFVLFCALRRRICVPLASAIALAILVLLFAVAPFSMKGALHVDARFAVMFGFLVFAGIRPVRFPRSVVIATAVVAVGLFATRMAVLAATWHSAANDLATFRRVIAPVQPGDSVFVAVVSLDEAPDYWRHAPAWRRLSNGVHTDVHLPALLLIERHAFWPFLFDNPSQQPIELRPYYNTLAEHVGGMPEHHLLAEDDRVDLCGFDYVLVLDAGGEPNLDQFDSDRLTLVTRSDTAALLRIVNQPAKCGGT